MKRYARVLFKKGGAESAKLQRCLTENLCICGIISVDRLQVEKWYEQDRLNPAGCVHNIVLHDKKEVEKFNRLMKSGLFDSPDIYWKIFRYPKQMSFKQWTEWVIRKDRKKEEKHVESDPV